MLINIEPEIKFLASLGIQQHKKDSLSFYMPNIKKWHKFKNQLDILLFALDLYKLYKNVLTTWENSIYKYQKQDEINNLRKKLSIINNSIIN